MPDDPDELTREDALTPHTAAHAAPLLLIGRHCSAPQRGSPEGA
jgi:hypothetical protein